MAIRNAVTQKALPEAWLQPSSPRVLVTDRDPDLSKQEILSLACTLQRTLELDELLDLFAEKLSANVSYQSFGFESEDDGYRYGRGGSAGKYSCDYRLVLFQECLGLVKLTRKRPFRISEIQLFESYVTALVYPLRNALLYRRALADARTDPVTGISNRAAFNETLEREIQLAHRHGRDLSLIMVDADHFKRINDNYGHIVGDAVLRGLAQRLVGAIRCCDTAYRYGGEEFSIILSSTNYEGAKTVGSKLRSRVEEMPFYCDSIQLPVTVSIGVGNLHPGDTFYSVIERTDKALYLAKALGRNRVATEQDLLVHSEVSHD